MSDTTRHPLRKILVGTDFSLVAEAAVEQAARLAAASGAELRLIHAESYAEAAAAAAALQPATLEAMRAHALRQLENRAQELRRRGLAVSTFIEHGQPSVVLLSAGAAWGADLLVVGTRGLGGLQRLLLGSTARRVVERATCPVLAVHHAVPEGRGPRRRVLVATDFSADARGAARRAIEILGLTWPRPRSTRPRCRR
jgi:nucleotide-binding universal stress UspA family protein